MRNKGSKRDQVEASLGMSMPEFLTQNCPQGMGRRDIVDKINAATDCNPKIGVSSIYYWVIDLNVSGLSDFSFSVHNRGKKKGSTNRLKKIIKPVVVSEEITDETTPVVEKSLDVIATIEEPEDDCYESYEEPRDDTSKDEEEIEMTLTCLKCGHKETRVSSCRTPNIIGLRAHRCPSCLEWGSFRACFRHKDVDVIKVVKDVDDLRKECFVDENEEIIPSPFALAAQSDVC